MLLIILSIIGGYFFFAFLTVAYAAYVGFVLEEEEFPLNHEAFPSFVACWFVSVPWYILLRIMEHFHKAAKKRIDKKKLKKNYEL